MIKFLYLSLGGIAGALLRYITSGVINQVLGISFPYGTFVVNMTGSFLIGFLWGLSENIVFSPNMRLFLFVGLLGSFTTFSTFALESMNYLRDNNARIAIANIMISNILGVVLVLAGMFLAKFIFTTNS
ncbi:MAG: fluoride efflux transporter CrcB [Cyclobacteriaceae bacterium]|nr:fluoride efflux transporter CrcB [Cyclobacteriaceae bacterium]